MMKSNIFRAIGDGTSTSVWSDCWISPGLRLSDVIENIPNDLIHLNVNDLSGGDGVWHLNPISGLIPTNLVNRILAIPPPSLGNGSDAMLWPGNNLGQFSIFSSYSLLANYEIQEDCAFWKKDWKCGVPERVREFL